MKLGKKPVADASEERAFRLPQYKIRSAATSFSGSADVAAGLSNPPKVVILRRVLGLEPERRFVAPRCNPSTLSALRLARSLLRLLEAFLKEIRVEETVLSARNWPTHELLYGSLSTYCRTLLLQATRA